MARTFRKQTHDDYLARVSRVNASFLATHRDRSHEHPIAFGLLGFLWFYLVLSIATRKSDILSSLQSGALPEDMHNLVLSVIAVMLGTSLVVLIYHLARFVIRQHDRRNSGGLVFGAIAALGLTLTPPAVLEAGYGLLDDNTRTLVATTQNKMRNIDWNEVVMVSSQMITSE